MPATAQQLTFTDSHAHMDDRQFDGDRAEVVAQAQAKGVNRIINIGYEPERWTTSLQLASSYPGVHVALGMHPGSVSQWNSSTKAELAGLLAHRHVVAVGETGIDLFRGEKNLADQIRCFEDQLELAYVHNLPVVIHMRSAEQQVLEVLQHHSKLPTLLFHSFEGSELLTEFVLENQTLVGVGGLAMRAKSVTIRQQLQRIPLQQMVLETDSPYLPIPGGASQRNTPAAIPEIAAFLAELKQVSVQEISDTTTKNVDRLFKRLNEV